MPKIITHAVAAWATGKIIFTTPQKKLLAAGIICSMLPDADVISFSFGISYDNLWGHRGITHSIFFALVLAGIVSLFFRENKPKAFLFLFLATLSHPLLDALTNGGRGVALLAPFSEERFFFPWRPIKVSPFGFDAFRSFRVLGSEITWIWIPFLALLLFVNIIRKPRT